MASSDISSIPTPAHCLADFCLIPVSPDFTFQKPSINPDATPGNTTRNLHADIYTTTSPHHNISDHAARPLNWIRPVPLIRSIKQIGTSSPSVSAQIADVQRLIEKSGLKYVMHSAGTTLEGPWDKVHQVIGQAHTLLHQQGVVRIQTDVRVGSRFV
ncbi:hypothetical protein ETB97_003145 [Aspergillus alliaceus]|uniref:Thiamine-binding protein domain-containing protein n=1 Tax=Petromyces alliaceus TaxID=209559 RepID=A0A8H6A268_PETAA|nr:hypothetical protein ETB97_003145 [Aspergillus burnettii]